MESDTALAEATKVNSRLRAMLGHYQQMLADEVLKTTELRVELETVNAQIADTAAEL